MEHTVEQVEKREDAQLAREIEIGLPVELTKGEQMALLRDYVQRTFGSKECGSARACVSWAHGAALVVEAIETNLNLEPRERRGACGSYLGPLKEEILRFAACEAPSLVLACVGDNAR